MTLSSTIFSCKSCILLKCTVINKDKIIVNKTTKKIEIKETDTIAEKTAKEAHNKQINITKKIEYYLVQEYSIELILENVEDIP